MIVNRRTVLDWFSKEIRHPVTFQELGDLLRLDKKGRAHLQEVLRSLTTSGEVVRIKGGRFGLPQKMNLVAGQLRCSPKGYGFVVPPRGTGVEVFVRLPNMGGALHGDEVVARIEHRKPDGRVEGSVIRVLVRANERLLGRYELGKAYGYVVPLEAKVLTDVIVAPDQTMGAKEGQIVEAEIVQFPGETREASGRIVALVGWPQDPGVDIELVLRRHDLPRTFPAEVRAAAHAVPREVPEEAASYRTDFRRDLVVTIDGEKARDFDDAVSAVRTAGGGFRLQVHIADVAHYVTPGSTIDVEARKRATSVYFPDLVIPMLPEELSNGICSLNPDVDRLVLSVVIDLDREGSVTGRRFHEGIIRSRERMTYEKVNKIVVDQDPALRARYRDVAPLLETMRDLAALLGRKRRERGSLDFDLPESEIVLNVAGEMTGIKRGERLMSHNLIEEFMILANETVAEHFITANLPSVYRIHEAPSVTDVEELNRTLAHFGYEVDVNSPKSFRELMERVKGRPEERFVNTVALRTMKLARYDPANLGHYGLASTAYTHFTSPIRRYPDLVVHRLLREAMRRGTQADTRREAVRIELDLVTAECSRLERRAEEAEREYIERKKARFMADKIGETFWGVVTAVEAFGFFVELEEYFVDGLVHLTTLHDDYYIHDETAHRLSGENTGRTFRLGDRVRVEVSHVDLLRRKVDFAVVESEPAPAPDPGSRPAAKTRAASAERSTSKRRRRPTRG